MAQKTNWIDESDLSWNLIGMLNQFDIPHDDKIKLCDEYAHRIKLWMTSGFGAIYSFDEFLQIVKGGGFIDYDGIGKFIDDNGDVLSNVCCNCEWLIENKPENSNYIMWYNR